MTVEDAIQYLNVLKNEVDAFYRKAIETLIYVSEKQIPKKVKERYSEIASCPVCGTTVLRIDKYCAYCGQAIDGELKK